MKTRKSCSTISYNTPEFLYDNLCQLMNEHKISNFMFIQHYAEEDEKKDHIHLFIQPNTLIDTMDLQDILKEPDPDKPDKLLKCLDFRVSKIDDWLLYNMHFEPYLASKLESRKFHYETTDFVYADYDLFLNDIHHAMRGSDWAQKNQLLLTLAEGELKGYELIEKGVVPLSLATAISSYQYMKENSGFTNRGFHSGHD